MKQINSAILKAELKDLQEVVNEQLDEVFRLEGRIPQIEFDIIMENIRKMYTNLQLLYRLNNPFEKSIRENVPPVVEKESHVEPIMSHTAPVIQLVENPVPPPALETSGTSGGSATQGNPPSDIKTLININDKFLFINELFDGNLRDYSLAIEQLNSIKEKPASFTFVDGLMRENFWDTQSQAFRKLKEILEKRFA